MQKLDDRFIETTFGNSNSITADDIPYDESNSVKDKIDAGNSGTTSATGTLSSWTSDSGSYRADFTHSLDQRPVNVQCYDSSWKLIVPKEIELTSTTVVRIWLEDNTTTVNIICNK